MTKFCLKCGRNTLPHDERIGQIISNHFRPNEGTYSTEQMILEYKAQIADRIFNADDHELRYIIMQKLYCESCKKGGFYC